MTMTNKIEILRTSDRKVFKAEATTRSNAVATFMEYCAKQVENQSTGISILYLNQIEISRVLVHHSDDGWIVGSPYRTDKNQVKGLY